MGILSYMQKDTDMETNPLIPPEEDEFPGEEEYCDSTEETGEESSEENNENPPPPNLEKETPLPDFPLYESAPPGTSSSVITVFPKPIIPCYLCNSEQNGLVRFLNAAAGYNPFLIYISNQLAVNGLSNGEMSQYGRVSASQQTITVGGQSGYVYVEKQITVNDDRAVTVAIINTDYGLDIMEIQDVFCNGGINTGCFRVSNLSITNRQIHVVLNGGAITFPSVDYLEVTSFRYALTGLYMVSVSNANRLGENLLLTSNIYIRGNASYTLYVFNWSAMENAIRTLIVEDRRY